MKKFISCGKLFLILVFPAALFAQERATTHGLPDKNAITIKIDKKYLNLPVAQQVERGTMQLLLDGKAERTFVIRLAANPEYWVFCDITPFIGKTLTIHFDGDAFSYAMERLPQDAGAFQFWGSHPVEVTNLEIYPMKSI